MMQSGETSTNLMLPETPILQYESALARRHAIPEPQEVVVEFTHDVALLHQYYDLRERTFISTWGLQRFNGKEDKYDAISDILIARQGNVCVGGSRLTYSTPEHPIDLPMERPGFRLATLFPELELGNKTYGECTRFALIPEYRSKDISTRLRTMIILRSPQVRAAYCFWLAPLPLARTYRQSCLNLGFPCRIATEIDIPDKDDYEGIKMYLGIMDFTSVVSSVPVKLKTLETAD